MADNGSIETIIQSLNAINDNVGKQGTKEQQSDLKKAMAEMNKGAAELNRVMADLQKIQSKL